MKSAAKIYCPIMSCIDSQLRVSIIKHHPSLGSSGPTAAVSLEFKMKPEIALKKME